MKANLFLTLILLLISRLAFSQLNLVKSPIKKTENQIRVMMKRSSSGQTYNKEGLVIYYEYPEYNIYFSFNNFRCFGVTVISTKKIGDCDQEILRWLYENNFEPSAEKENFFSKMFIEADKNKNSWVYVHKLDSKAWYMWDALEAPSIYHKY